MCVHLSNLDLLGRDEPNADPNSSRSQVAPRVQAPQLLTDYSTYGYVWAPYSCKPHHRSFDEWIDTLKPERLVVFGDSVMRDLFCLNFKPDADVCKYVMFGDYEHLCVQLLPLRRRSLSSLVDLPKLVLTLTSLAATSTSRTSARTAASRTFTFTGSRSRTRTTCARSSRSSTRPRRTSSSTSGCGSRARTRTPRATRRG